jgi:retron-type reverse transcriptase
MPGIDKNILDTIIPDHLISRVKRDLASDFILAPHYNAIFLKVGDELWQETYSQLKSGKYQPELPLTIDVPKEKQGFTRPGSVLQPIDRLVYHSLVDLTLPLLEEQLDRGRTFSHIPSGVTSTDHLFDRSQKSWDLFQSKVLELCHQGGYVVKADVSNYFERIPQHHLINLMQASGCPTEVVRLLEELLLAFQERNSFGIIQGVFPSDILGNFYLSDFDAFCELNDIPSARYVDDFYLQFHTEKEAKQGLTSLISRLRQNGLHLNEHKSGIRSCEQLIKEETEIDDLFQEAYEEIENEMIEARIPRDLYGFPGDWELHEITSNLNRNEIHISAVTRLYKSIEDFPDQATKIERFCLPFLGASASEVAVERAIQGVVKRPHLTRIYQSYLSRFTNHIPEVVEQLEHLLNSDELVLDYQLMYILGALMNSPKIEQQTTVKKTLQLLGAPHIGQETRALAAIFAAKHGSPNQQRSVKLRYEKEASSYVRGAILYASKYFTSVEQKTCIRAWGGHNSINALISAALRKN